MNSSGAVDVTTLIRYCKAVSVALIASYYSLVVVNNLLDYSTNLQYIQHTLGMEDIVSTHYWRLISSPVLQKAVYLTAIALIFMNLLEGHCTETTK